MRFEVFVEHHLDDFRRLQRVDDKGGGVRRPGNDVDALALQFAHHRLHARTAHADAGADRIDRRIARDHGDLRAGAGIARDRFDLDHAVVDFRHFLLEQLGHELRMRAREKNLRPALFPAHIVHIGAQAVARTESLARDHFVAANNALAASEVDDDIAIFDPLDDAVDDLADAVLELFVLAVALGLAHLLHDDLLGRLRGDAAKIERRQRFGNPVAGLRRRIALARVGHRDLRRVIVHGVDDQHQARKAHLAGARIDFGAHLGLLAVTRARRLLQRVLHRGDDDRAIDRFLARDSVGDLQNLQSIGADGHCFVSLRRTDDPARWPLEQQLAPKFRF